ncbi:cyclic nucleotide-binding domain-containing protein [Mariprofundus erugo]|uniref:Crp/Fnr family transcriptional regulator n=1 Tax=Mariprofundus erugo TaxID=2528639 RepID=UPI0010FD7E04|nr:cyclic nucleotide-binding domain-containing protein [Mariprofundus erugo]TLS74470.1 cyclic nucleotide-binding domain-containing protein [Mariprofundus erugo]
MQQSGNAKGVDGLQQCGNAVQSASMNHHKERIDEIIEMTGAIPLFDRIDNTQVAMIAEEMKVVRLAAGKRLFSEGDESGYMCFVVSGKLEAFKQTRSGKSVSVLTLSRGRTIGEMSLLDHFPRSATVVTCSECTLLVMTRERFEYILERRPRVGTALMLAISRSLSLNMRRTMGQLADLQDSARAVTAATVIKAEQPRAKQPGFIDQIMNRKQSGLPPFIRQFG